MWVEKKVKQEAEGVFVGPTPEIKVQAVTSMKEYVLLKLIVLCSSLPSPLYLSLSLYHSPSLSPCSYASPPFPIPPSLLPSLPLSLSPSPSGECKSGVNLC